MLSKWLWLLVAFLCHEYMFFTSTHKKADSVEVNQEQLLPLLSFWLREIISNFALPPSVNISSPSFTALYVSKCNTSHSGFM